VFLQLPGTSADAATCRQRDRLGFDSLIFIRISSKKDGKVKGTKVRFL
jgi:hypothetical protein